MISKSTKILVMTEKIVLDDDCEQHCFAMGDFEIHLKQSKHNIKIIYVSEPPFGDSYHKLYINDVEFIGFVWGCNFLFPFGQEYLICSWMEELYNRKTIFINLKNLKYFTLSNYYYTFTLVENSVQLTDSESNDIKLLNLEEIKRNLR